MYPFKNPNIDKNDYRNVLSDEGKSESRVIKGDLTTPNVSCMFKVVVPDGKKSLKDSFYLEILSPVLKGRYVHLHGVGKRNLRYPESHVPSQRTYTLVLSTALTDEQNAYVNAEESKKTPGYDGKKERKFYVEGLLSIKEDIIDAILDDPEVMKETRASLDLDVRESMVQEKKMELNIKKANGIISPQEYTREIAKLELPDKNSRKNEYEKKLLSIELDAEVTQQRFREAFANLVKFPVKPETDHGAPDDFTIETDIKVFKLPKGVPMPSANIGDKAIPSMMNAMRMKRRWDSEYHLECEATRKLCEEIGYEYQQMMFLNKDLKGCMSDPYYDPLILANFLMKVCHKIHVNCTKGGTVKVKFPSPPSIMLVKDYDPPPPRNQAFQRGFGTDWNPQALKNKYSSSYKRAREYDDHIEEPDEKKAKMGENTVEVTDEEMNAIMETYENGDC